MEHDSTTPTASDKDLELLSQYLDGEMDSAARCAFEARLSAEPLLADTLAALRELNVQLRHAITRDTRIPGSVSALLGSQPAVRPAESPRSGESAKVLRFPGAPQREQVQPSRRRHWSQAIAASVVLALGVFIVTDQQSLPPVEGLPGNDALVSAALDSQASGSDWLALEDGRSIQPVLTFEHRDGGWCREYLLRGAQSDWRGVACRDGERWVTQAAGLESYLGANDVYRPAGAGDAAPVAVFISQHAADIALGRDDELALINRNWN